MDVPNIIAIEGVDGVGKSKLCAMIQKELANETDVTVTKTPCGPFKNIASVAKMQGLEGSFSAYMLANASVPRLFPNYRWIILDRYTLSTIAFHIELLDSLDVGDLLGLSGCIAPKYTFYLEAPPDIIRDRLTNRHAHSNHNLTTVSLQERFEHALNNQASSGSLGDLRRCRSLSENDLRNASDDILNIIFSR